MRLLLSAAEPSGDRLAAEVLAELGPGVEAWGLAGPRLREAGVEPVARMEAVSVMGLTEVVRRLPEVRATRAALRAALRERRPDALICVDAPELHLPLAREARALGVPAVQIGSPQVWAWRPGRVDAIAGSVDLLLCLFAFEPPLFAEAAARAGCRVVWMGHPVRDRVPARGPVDPLHLGLLPGSRPQEVDRHAAVFLEAAARLRRHQPELRATVVVPEAVRPRLPPLPPWVVAAGSAAALSDCRAALTKSGTVTLELACMGVPMVVAHAVAPLTWAVGRRLVRGVSHVALPNVLAGEAVVPEVLQALDPGRLAEELAALPARQPLDLSALGPPGAAGRAAGEIRRLLGA